VRSLKTYSMRPFVFLALLAGSLTAREIPKESQPPQSFVIGISPYLGPSVKDEVYRNLVRLLVEGLPLNSTLAVFDAFELKTVTQVTVPNLRVFDSPKTRANQFAPAIRELKSFLAQDHPRPPKSSLNFDGAIRLPQFCDFLEDNLPAAAPGPLAVLLIGSPLYQDTKEPAFSMVDGYFPSDGHLQAQRERSVFGLREPTNASAPLLVHWVYFGDPWVSDLHKEKITRFWTLYLQRRGGQLASFSGDLTTALQAFRQGRAAASASAKHWAIDTDQTKIEMLRITRDVPVTDWLTREAGTESAPPAPTTITGPMRIGIRWSQNIDLDLYAMPRRGAETLFFQHTRSPEGYYYKDHRSSPGREFEFIEFETPVDIREVEAFVNFYKGRCAGGPHGEVRIEFDGRIYSAPFAIVAAEGNQGRSGHDQQDFWTRIPIQQILKVSGLHDSLTRRSE
jgi:hypothetical protein